MPLKNLNPEQSAAARAPLGHNLIIASAGTGKTSTIVARIAHLLQNDIPPSSIMLLTFTNKAASEMISRLEKGFARAASEIQAGTFHAIAYRYLKAHSELLLKQPRELKTLLRSIYDEKNFSIDSRCAPYKADYLYELMSLFVNSARENENFGDFIVARNDEHESYAHIYEEVLGEFLELKRRYNYASYDDLLLLYREKITQDSNIFSEILVDEYQDTNALQNSIILAHNARSLFCVGDYDQSIYAFNGSDIGIIASFKDRFKDAQIFTLSKNYRSTGKILSIANRVISHNPRIYPKSLEVLNKNEDGDVGLLIFRETKEQYRAIARKISLLDSPLSEIAIIFRNNISSDYMEAALRECGISARKKGAKSFFESKEVAVFIDILNLFFNPKDMMAAIHVFSYGSGIGERVAKEIYEALMNLGSDIKNGLLHPKNINPFARDGGGLFDDILSSQDCARFNAHIRAEFASHPILAHPKLSKNGAEFLDKIHALFSFSRKSLSDVFTHILKSHCWREISSSIARTRIRAKYKTSNENKLNEALSEISARILVLQNIAKPYDDLGRFLHAIVLNNAESSSGAGVNLLTIHASKGLEFDEVYVIDLMEGRFPNTKLMQKTGSLEEERRLFYVASTRAKRNLYFSFAHQDSYKNISYAPSTFLKEAGLI